MTVLIQWLLWLARRQADMLLSMAGIIVEIIMREYQSCTSAEYVNDTN